ncbi:hypothetical protein MLD38_034884 [Melastoma candidum]|uniref:Uncharacterized protein n=1 Tax=Melastoma candidum TaxID=119954 RepID=A0ACB9MDI3_9MYRT|nr:hypothetical protein MLD38_034884 [Melastoma candidum]
MAPTKSTPVNVMMLGLLTLLLPPLSSTLGQSDNYIIHMDPTFMPKAYANTHAWHLATLSSILQSPTHTPESKLIYTYTDAIQGFAANLSPDELMALEAAPGFTSHMQDRSATIDTTYSPRFLGLNPYLGAWPASGYGKDVIIGMVDTGIWPESRSFRDDGFTDVPSTWRGKCEAGTQFNSSMCNKKLIGARFFNKGLIAMIPHANITMNSTRDIFGHGTHTSSTAAGRPVEGASFFGYAQGTAVGVAPMARVAMYKVFWDEGRAMSDVIAAIDQAIKDGVHVLSLSFGFDDVQLYEDPIAIATFSAIKKGIFVSTSAGNEGPRHGSLHNGIPWVITVAAGDMDRDFRGSITLGDGHSLNGTALFVGDSISIEDPIIFMGFCNDTSKLNKTRQILVLCEDEQILDYQLQSVRDSGVAGAIFITNVSSLDIFIPTPFPAVFVNHKDGETIKDYVMTSSDPKARLQFHQTVYKNRPAPRVASFTSRGPSSSCPAVLKPDIVAPGMLVLAAWPPNVGIDLLGSQTSAFNMISGTSMACPHITGVAALLRDIYPNWSPAAIRSAIMTTSYSIDSTNAPIKDTGFNDEPASPLAMGAGHVDPNKAMDPGLVYDATSQDYVNLMCALNFTEHQIKIITKSSSNDCSRASLDLNYPAFIAFYSVNTSSYPPIQEFRRTVTNVGDSTSSYKAEVTPMEGFDVTVVPDKLTFREKFEKLSFKLSIRGPKQMKKNKVIFGYLKWVETEMKHIVTSPIVATNIIMD